jgi:hypothetical protein
MTGLDFIKYYNLLTVITKKKVCESHLIALIKEVERFWWRRKIMNRGFL